MDLSKTNTRAIWAFRLLVAIWTLQVADGCLTTTVDTALMSDWEGYIITSPNYPSSYYDNEDRCYVISTDGSSLTVVVRVYDLEGGVDYIFINDGPFESSTRLGNPTGSGSSDTYYTTGQNVFINFYSDASITQQGFQICVYATENAGVICKYESDGSSDSSGGSSGGSSGTSTISLSIGAIIGIVFGSLFLLVFIIVLVCACVKKGVCRCHQTSRTSPGTTTIILASTSSSHKKKHRSRKAIRVAPSPTPAPMPPTHAPVSAPAMGPPPPAHPGAPVPSPFVQPAEPPPPYTAPPAAYPPPQYPPAAYPPPPPPAQYPPPPPPNDPAYPPQR